MPDGDQVLTAEGLKRHAPAARAAVLDRARQPLIEHDLLTDFFDRPEPVEEAPASPPTKEPATTCAVAARLPAT